jgi:hypothetical protein
MKKKKKKIVTQSQRIVNTYKDGFQLAKEYKLMNTFRYVLLILRNEITISTSKPRGTATVQEMFNYLIQGGIINYREREFVSWLKSWKGYLMVTRQHSREIQRRLKCAFTGQPND